MNNKKRQAIANVKVKPMDPNLIVAFNRGKDAIKKDVHKKLDSLSDLPGIGPKMADRIREHFKDIL